MLLFYIILYYNEVLYIILFCLNLDWLMDGRGLRGILIFFFFLFSFLSLVWFFVLFVFEGVFSCFLFFFCILVFGFFLIIGNFEDGFFLIVLGFGMVEYSFRR